MDDTIREHADKVLGAKARKDKAKASDERGPTAKANGPDVPPPTSAKLKKFTLIPVRSIRYDPKDDHWLIDGLLPMTGLAAIWGKYKSFKSFIAFAVAVALADAHLKKWGDRALHPRPGRLRRRRGHGRHRCPHRGLPPRDAGLR